MFLYRDSRLFPQRLAALYKSLAAVARAQASSVPVSRLPTASSALRSAI